MFTLKNSSKIKSLCSALLLVSTSLSANNAVEKISSDEQAKKVLIEKLSSLQHFSADFSQQVFDIEKNLLQEGAGTLIVSKPNKVYWQTTSPEESLIVSDGETLWLYDPFIEQASAYSYQSSIDNTPILLLTNQSSEHWAKYSVNHLGKEQYQILANNEQSQVKSLTITFEESEISALSIIDATGQKSNIRLSNANFKQAPDAKLFHFVLPEGTYLDDQR